MKNLEDEYRKSQQESIPLLWDRIEKKLPEKKKKKKIVFFSPYLGICAAAVLLFLLVPNLFHLVEGSSLSESTPQEKSAESFMVTEGEEQTARDESLENEDATILNGYQENEGIMKQESGAESPVGEMCEIMKVTAYSETNDLQIITLERADGSMLQAFLANEIDLMPQIGESYLFTVTVDSDNIDYLKIENVIEIQN